MLLTTCDGRVAKHAGLSTSWKLILDQRCQNLYDVFTIASENTAHGSITDSPHSTFYILEHTSTADFSAASLCGRRGSAVSGHEPAAATEIRSTSTKGSRWEKSQAPPGTKCSQAAEARTKLRSLHNKGTARQPGDRTKQLKRRKINHQVWSLIQDRIKQTKQQTNKINKQAKPNGPCLPPSAAWLLP